MSAAAGSTASRPPMARLGEWVTPAGRSARGSATHRPAPRDLPCHHGHRRCQHLSDSHRHRRPSGMDRQNRPHPALSGQPQPRRRTTPTRRPPRARSSFRAKPRLAYRHHHRMGEIPPRPRGRGRTTPNLLTARPARHFTSAKSLSVAPPCQGPPHTRPHALPQRQRYRADQPPSSRLFRGVECAPSRDTARAPPHESAGMKKCQKTK